MSRNVQKLLEDKYRINNMKWQNITNFPFGMIILKMETGNSLGKKLTLWVVINWIILNKKRLTY